MESKVTNFRKSTYSGNGGGNCVECGAADIVFVRDSNDKKGPHLQISPKTWRLFISRIQRDC